MEALALFQDDVFAFLSCKYCAHQLSLYLLCRILNKLTPEKFDLLKGQLIDSGITTADILKVLYPGIGMLVLIDLFLIHCIVLNTPQTFFMVHRFPII